MRKTFLFVLSFLLFTGLSSFAQANSKILQEGWFKVLSGGAHVGYLAQRFEYNDKKKQYSTLYFLKTSALGGNIIESLDARVDEKFNPISFKFSTTNDKETKIIDALVTKGMDLKIDQVINGKKESLTKKVPKGTFLSSFLVFMIMRNGGLKVGNNYQYSAIAEEDASIHKGEAFVSATQKVAGIDTFRVLNSFKETRFISSVSPLGEVISTRAPVESIETVQVGNIDHAVGSIPLAEKSLKALFGDLPKPSALFAAKVEVTEATSDKPSEKKTEEEAKKAPDAAKEKTDAATPAESSAKPEVKEESSEKLPAKKQGE